MIRDEVRFSRHAPPVPVLSAFGGLAIYDAAARRPAPPRPLPAPPRPPRASSPQVLRSRDDPASVAPGVRYSGVDEAMVPPACHPLWTRQDCEHVAFHAALRAYHGGALAVCVHPRLLNCPGQAARDPNLLRA